MEKPKRLGRGLSSLVAMEPIAITVESPTPTSAHPNTLSDVTYVDLSLVTPSPFQPRRVMDDAALTRLADSIRRSGLLQPVLVRRSGSGYELVAGERRWRAAKIAGLNRIPALVRELSDEAAAEHAIVENVQREDLNPMERGWALRSLGEKFGVPQAQLAERVGLERSTVANLIRLTELEPEIAAMISAGELTAGHGKALLAVAAGEPRIALARTAARDQVSVRELERMTQTRAVRLSPEAVGGGKSDDARLAVLADLQRQIGQQLGTKVTIVTDRRGKKGKITLEFYGLDHFDALMTRLGVKTQ